jgi:ribosome-associated translation inhibitor RaiA
MQTGVNVTVTTGRGHAGPRMRRYAAAKLGRALRYAPRPVLSARVRLELVANPAIAEPAAATALVHVGGRVLRVHATGRTLRAAVDLLTRRLAGQLSDLGDRLAAHRRDRDVPARR